MGIPTVKYLKQITALIYIHSLDVDYACSERPMGTEVQHIFYGEMDCRCGNRLSYTVTAVEYPEGAYDFHTCESAGCTYIDKPSAEMDYYLPEPVLSIYIPRIDQ